MLQFLSVLYKSGLGYSAMGTAQSAISLVIKLCGNVNINSFEVLTRSMEDLVNEHPSLPRYQSTWDVKIVLNYLQSFQYNIVSTVM